MATTLRSESRSSVLLAPLDYLSARTLTTIAVAQALVGLLLSLYGIRYDGLIDVHRTWLGEATPLVLAVLDQIASLVVAAMGAALALRAWGAAAIDAIGIRSHVPQRGGTLAAVVLNVLLCAEVASKLFLAAAG